MKKALLSLVIASGALSLSNTAKAASYILQYSDTYGDVAMVYLTTGISGYTDGSELVISGTLTLNSSMNSDAYLGTYTLVAGGPASTDYFMAPGKEYVYFDNLFYPNQNAGQVSMVTAPPTHLTSAMADYFSIRVKALILFPCLVRASRPRTKVCGSTITTRELGYIRPTAQEHWFQRLLPLRFLE